MRCADVTHWFDANRLFSEQLEQVADRLLTLAQTESRIGCEVANVGDAASCSGPGRATAADTRR